MTLPNYSLRQLLEAGVHFGHQTHRWNPLMDQYIYGSRNGIHIIDLTQTMTLLSTALDAIHKMVSKGGSILFVGTKRQAQSPVSEAAQKCAQYYINYRWLGGTLTNWKTVSNSIMRLKELDQIGLEELEGFTKKERLNIELAERTGQELSKVKEDTDRDFYMSPQEAVDYGLIDSVLNKKPVVGS